jgi:F0F1-type ATP synthase membrane subunit b/b'
MKNKETDEPKANKLMDEMNDKINHIINNAPKTKEKLLALREKNRQLHKALEAEIDLQNKSGK